MIHNRPLRIVLISPKGPLYRHRIGAFGKGLRYMPLTFPVLASLIPRDIDVELRCIDEGIQDADLDLDTDLIGMTVITGNATRAYELASHYRNRNIPVVMGGPHVTLAPEDVLPHADCIVTGYAEESWPQLLYDFVSGQMKQRYDQSPELSLDDMPLPKREVLPRRKYITSHVYEATRGCTHNCEFCVVPSAWGRRPLQQSVENIVADMKAMKSTRAAFVDLNLIADRKYAVKLFKALVPLNVKWFGLATTLLVHDQELLDLAAESGCCGLLIGLESISTNSLKLTQKGFNNPSDYENVVKQLHQRKISLQGCFVFGLDEDRDDVFEKTANFAVDVGIDLPRFAIATPFPGTALYKRMELEGRILTRNWELYDGQHVVFQPKHLSVEALEEGNQHAWHRAYCLKGMAKRLRQTVMPLPIAMIVNWGYRRYARNLKRFYNCGGMMAPDWAYQISDSAR
ncbi:B12-binding domain-containing radical SAM protein [Planctomycetota bacterium]|nr:B12-binding domain-containing radical SAM protein [Planctomycetota bacterium]